MKSPITIIALILATVLLLANAAFGQETNEKSEKASKENSSASASESRSATPDTTKKDRNVDPTPSNPQGSSDTKWHFEIAPYLWAAALDGNLRVRNTTTTVESSFSDIFKQLDFAFATRAEAAKGKWRLMFDENYVNLGTTGRGPIGQNVKVEPTLNFFEFATSYAPLIRANKEATDAKPLPPVLEVELLAGARYTHFGLGLEPANAAAVEGKRNLVDGFVGNRIKARPHPAVTLIAKYTVGGGGSHFAWTFSGLADLRFRKSMSIWGGYQILDMDANKPSNTIGFNGQMRGLIFGATMYR